MENTTSSVVAISPDTEAHAISVAEAKRAKAEGDSDPTLSRSGVGERPKEIATESGHWYLPDGTPFYSTPRRSGKLKGELRGVNLRFDREMLMAQRCVPSVTTVTKLLDKPGIAIYVARQVFEATRRLPDTATFKEAYDEAQKHRRAAAERGTELHGEIERYLRDHMLGGVKWEKHVLAVVDALSQYGIDINSGESERSFAYELGFGGKVDLHRRAEPFVIDFKSKEEITDDQLAGKDKLAYEEHAMQIAAYSVGLGIPAARGINVFVGEKDQRVFIYEHTRSDLARGWKLFVAILQAWRIKNNYYVKL